MVRSSLSTTFGVRQRRLRTSGKISKPIAKDRRRRRSGREIRPKCKPRKLDTQWKPSLNAGALLETCQPVFGLGVEITGGEGRIGIAFAGKKPGDVAQIFPLQRQRVVFRMSL